MHLGKILKFNFFNTFCVMNQWRFSPKPRSSQGGQTEGPNHAQSVAVENKEQVLVSEKSSWDNNN
jgi:hypothetical protein